MMLQDNLLSKGLSNKDLSQINIEATKKSEEGNLNYNWKRPKWNNSEMGNNRGNPNLQILELMTLVIYLVLVTTMYFDIVKLTAI